MPPSVPPLVARGLTLVGPELAGQNLSQNRPDRIENRGERQGDRDQRRDEVRNQYEQNNPGNFWQENPGWSCLGYYAPLRVGELGFGGKLVRLQRRTNVLQLR